MIRLPDLDDQKYSDIVEAAKRRISVVFPEWTDYNEHDPGITIIELFAWLKEMQQYYLNRISDRSYENMLKLLGIDVYPPCPAKTAVYFGNGNAPEKVTKGSVVKTADGVVFTVDEHFTRAPFHIGRIFIENNEGFVDISDIASDHETSFSPFGNRLHNDSCRLYIELDINGEKCYNHNISLFFDTMDRCAVSRNPIGGSSYLPRDIAWEYSTADGFSACQLIRDDTSALSFSGEVLLKTGDDLSEISISGLPQGRWLRARLLSCGCEDMPRLKSIYTDVLSLSQRRVDASFQDFVLSEGDVFVSDMLAVNGLCFVLLRDKQGWQYIEDAVVEKRSDGVLIKLVDHVSLAAADGSPDVRVIYCSEDFARTRMFMSSDGLPCQEIEFDCDGLILTQDLKIMVYDREDSAYPRWKEYSYIDSLELAGPYDLCFTYDPERRKLLFGDNENGEAPSYGSENIMVISCAVTSGIGGNTPAGSLTMVESDGKMYPVFHNTACSGGRNRESFRHAMGRLKSSLNDCTRAVTADDYRILAMRTPGLRVADAKAIPFFDPDVSAYPTDGLGNTISLVVLPYSTGTFPMPDARFLDAVREHIENYRLITTRVKVIAPIYVKVDISADIVCGTREVDQAMRCAEAAVRKLLSVYDDNANTRFGEPVGESDIIAGICSADGVLAVKRLNISTEMAGCSRDRYGRLVIPPNAIAYCGEVYFNVTEP